MKKTLKRVWLKMLIVAFSLVVINCQVEEEVISGSHFGPQNKKFTFQDFLNETNIKDFDVFSKYNISNSVNGVMQKSIQQDFLTDTTEIKKFEIQNTDKTTYSFKLYPLNEQLNSKEYYNMIVEKNGTQLTYMVFFNKDKQNPAPNEAKTETSQMVFHSRSPHPGFSEAINYKFHCTQTGKCASTGVCDECSLCVSTTVQYIYIGTPIQSGNTGGGSNGAGGSGGGGGGSPLDGFYIPNPYDGMDMTDPSNSTLALSFQINNFINTLNPELKEVAKKYVNFAFAFEYFNIHTFNDATKQHYVTALTNYKNFIEATANVQLTTDAQAKLEYWAFQTYLNNNENGANTSKINNIKNFLNNPNVNTVTKDKISNELATKNNQEVLDFVSLLYTIHLNNQNLYPLDKITNSYFSPYPEISNFTDINPENITYETQLTTQSLPSLSSFTNSFPKNGTNGNYTQMSAPDVYNLVGGSLLSSYNNNPNYGNACTIRGSRGLLYSNIQIPVLKYNGTQRTQKGGDLKNYILDAVSFNKFMIDKFGDTPHVLEGAAANDPAQVLNFLSGKNGIYVIINNSSAQAGYSGHVDLIINGECIGNEYLGPNGGVKSIRIWVLN